MKYIISLATRLIPRHYLQHVSHFFLRFFSLFLRGSKFEDPINGITYNKLLPYGRLNSRENALAPDSMSLERHRLMWLFLQKKTDFFINKHKFLHVAPEFCFIKIFKNMKNIEYITGDLVSPWADVKMDVHNIPFPNNSFSIVICNHVLEHVNDDKKVMREFYRVMKPGGWGIFQVPIDTNNKVTQEDKNITDPQERERLYWQHDHLRLYGLDYAKKLTDAGFTVTESNFVNELDKDLVIRYALPKDEIIYFCQKS